MRNPVHGVKGQVVQVTGAVGTNDSPMILDRLEDQADTMAEIMKQQSIGRLGRADEVAAAVLWLCGPAASFVIGVGLPVNRGFTAY